MNRVLLLCVMFCLATGARSALVEEVIQVPVVVKTAYRQEVAHTIIVTVWRDDTRARAPYLILHHGRPPSQTQLTWGRQHFSDNAGYFVRLGFVVLVPTRVGYGPTGGPDVEDSGHWRDKRYVPVYAAIVDQTEAVHAAAGRLPYVDPTRGIVVGQSMGGTAAIASASRPVTGLLGTVNFAGGGGGNPDTMSADPCSVTRLNAQFKDYGASARVPTLWLYSENDRYWGARLPRSWFEGYMEAGGKGEFVALPAHGEDGHSSFVRNRAKWQGPFEAFVNRLGVLQTAPLPEAGSGTLISQP